MTRSVVVTTWFPDEAAPTRTPFCLAHVKALQSADVPVEVVHVALGEDEPPRHDLYEGVSVTRIGLRRVSPRSWLRVTRLVRARLGQADVLHTMAFSSVLVAALAWISRRRPWVHTEHWNGVTNPASAGNLWRALALLRHILRLPHVVTGVTEELASAMSAFARPGATRVVPCVVNPPRVLQPYPADPPLRLVAVGLLNVRKDPLLAVSTLAWLRDRGVDATLTWVGQGPLEAAVRHHATALGVTHAVELVGAVPPAEVHARLGAAHLFFVPSHQENFFTAAAEAISSGRGVVLPRSGGFVEYCTAANSVLCASFEPSSMGESILEARERLLTSSPQDIAATLGTSFTTVAVGRQFAAIYDQLAGVR